MWVNRQTAMATAGGPRFEQKIIRKTSLKFWALFSGAARAKLNFHQLFQGLKRTRTQTRTRIWTPTRCWARIWIWTRTRNRLQCLFTPQNFFNKHIRLTGHGSGLDYGRGNRSFFAAFLYLSKTT